MKIIKQIYNILITGNIGRATRSLRHAILTVIVGRVKHKHKRGRRI